MGVMTNIRGSNLVMKDFKASKGFQDCKDCLFEKLCEEYKEEEFGIKKEGEKS